MLETLHLGDGQNVGTADGRIALDCSVRPTRHDKNTFIISTTDFFFPLVDSPYLQGRIGAANVLSDLYAEGVEHCDFVLMLLAACRDMPPDQRDLCTQDMVRGFRDACDEAETTVTGGQTVLNPWPIIGGVATSVVKKEAFVPSDGANVGDVVVLTKPLGTQVAVNVHEWRRSTKCHAEKWNACMKQGITEQDAKDMMYKAVSSMARLNKNGAKLMIKHKVSAATDVTGFGILGHAQNLVENQQNQNLGMELHTLPLIANTRLVNDQVFNFRLTLGYSAETSGGLLLCLPEDQAQDYMQQLKQLDGGASSWIVGRVVQDPNQKAIITPDCTFLEV